MITYHCNCSSTISSTIKWVTTCSILIIIMTRLIGFKNTVCTGSLFQARQTRGPSNRTGEPEDHKHNSDNKILNPEITENRVNKGPKLERKVALQGYLPLILSELPDQTSPLVKKITLLISQVRNHSLILVQISELIYNPQNFHDNLPYVSGLR